MWYVPSTALPAAVQPSFVFLCACSAESYAAAPAIVRLGKKKKYFLEVEAVKILGTDCRRHERVKYGSPKHFICAYLNPA